MFCRLTCIKISIDFVCWCCLVENMLQYWFCVAIRYEHTPELSRYCSFKYIIVLFWLALFFSHSSEEKLLRVSLWKAPLDNHQKEWYIISLLRKNQTGSNILDNVWCYYLVLWKSAYLKFLIPFQTHPCQSNHNVLLVNLCLKVQIEILTRKCLC